MKAIRFHEYGGPEVLRVEDVTTPEPGAGEVRIRVAGAGFNPADAGIRAGYLQQAFPLTLPHIPNYDVSGTVDAVGEGVTRFAVGDAVVGVLSMTADGGAAEFVVTPADVLAAAPTTIALTDAGALPSTAITAYQALFEVGGLASGQRVLVNGAGGAVGGFAVQLARNAGAHVIATTGASSVQRVQALGADEVLVHGSEAPELDAPVDVLLNLGGIGESALAAMVPLVRDGGVLVNTVPSVPTPSDGSRNVRGVGFFTRSDRAVLAELVAAVDRGELRVEIAERVPLDGLREVHERSDAGTLHGKVIAIP